MDPNTHNRSVNGIRQWGKCEDRERVETLRLELSVIRVTGEVKSNEEK